MALLNSSSSTYLGDELIERAYLNNVLIPLGILKKGNFQTYTDLPYTAYTGMWGVNLPQNDDLIVDVDMRIMPSTFPANTTFRWDVTPDPDWSGVNGYLHIAYANYDWSPGTHTPHQVYATNELTVTQQWEFEGDEATGLLCECWLTETAHPWGELDDKLREVAFLPKVSTNGVPFLEDSAVVGSGSFVDGDGVTWMVRENMSATNEPYFMAYRPGYAEHQGSLDFTSLFNFLINSGKISGNEWCNGVALGPEPHSGAGSTVITDMQVIFTGMARAPWQVVNLSANVDSSSQITLMWTAAPGATSHQYQINGGQWMATDTGSVHVITGLSADTSYDFRVRGVNDDGDGAPSNTVSGVTNEAGVANVIANGTFVDDANWNGSWYSGKTISGGKANFTSSPAYDDFNQDISLVAGKYYELTWTISDYVSGNVFPQLVGGTNRNGTIRATNGTFTERLLANTGNVRFAFMMETGGTLSVSNISLIGPYDTAVVGGA